MQEISLPFGLLGNKSNNFKRRVLQWTDDTLVFSKTFDEFLDSFERILKEFKSKKVRLNLEKCKLLRVSVEYCGREVSRTGWKFPLHFYEKILYLKTSKSIYTHLLLQAMYVMNWLSHSIPEMAKLRVSFKSFIYLIGRKLAVLKREKILISETPVSELE